MITNKFKIVLFGALLVAMILPFSGMLDANAVLDIETNKKDKTKEMKTHKKNLDAKVVQFKEHMEKYIDLKEQMHSKQLLKKSTSSLQNQLDDEVKRWKVIAKQHKDENSIPELKLQKMMKQQSNFENKLIKKGLQKYITSVGIDLHTKEIQIGLDSSTVNSENKDKIINKIERLMGKNTNWHVVDSERATLDSCTTERYCDPLLGGNLISIPGIGSCSNGFKATLGGVFGFVTAGHCVDNKVGTTVSDDANDALGTVHSELMYWSTDCDCGFVQANSSETDKKTLLSTTSSVPVASYTTASNQQGDFIYKSGQKNSGLDYGTVTGINKSVFGVGIYIRALVESTAYHATGDSGGTVMGNTDSLYGIISAHQWGYYYHVPTDKIISKLGIAVVM